MPDATVTIKKDKINTRLPSQFVFLCFASFEQRSMTIPLAIEIQRISKAIIFKSKNTDNTEAVGKICERIKNNLIIELELNNPISVADKLTKVVKDLYLSGHKSLVIDSTTFTHETLLVFLKLLHSNKKQFDSILFLYNGANGYSVGDAPEQMWLSKGCRDVRNVVGYPGIIRPAAKTYLIILTGFELERATRLIELLEPDGLILGSGVDPVHDNHTDAMEYFRLKFSEWQSNYKNINNKVFSFSCKDVEKASREISDVINENSDDNYLIVPLNTKLSTIATALVAIQNSKVQVCYAIPEVYNTKNYSSPSESITIVELHKTGIFR